MDAGRVMSEATPASPAENREIAAATASPPAKRKRRQGGRGRPFAPGVSGNPGGRPKSVKEVQEYASQFTTEAIDRLVAIMRGPEPIPGVVVDWDVKESRQAAIAILDRACGRPAQPLTGGGGNSLESEFPDLLGALKKIAGEG